MSYFIYNTVITVLFILISPLYFLKVLLTNKYRETWQDRFGKIPAFSSKNDILWIHAASAGEVKVAGAIINNLNIFDIDIQLLVTTSTHSGLKIARTELAEKVRIHMLPFDLPWFIGPLLKRLQPKLTVIIEADIWPNFIKFAARQGNLIMINTWFDHKMIEKINTIPRLLPEVMKYFNKITVQTEYDKQQFKKIIDDDRIEITGNIKYDQAESNITDVNINVIKQDLKLNGRDRLFIAGSTHEKEEEIVLRTYKKLKVDYRNLNILIAPRHIERADDILQLCSNMNLNAVKKTDLMKKDRRQEDIIILDTLGELAAVYLLGTVTFIGGTFIDQGGHNILEALAAGNPVVFGPYYYNFKDIFTMAVKNNLAYKTPSEEELYRKLKILLSDRKRLNKINKKARKVIENNKGALIKNIKVIKKLLNN